MVDVMERIKQVRGVVPKRIQVDNDSEFMRKTWDIIVPGNFGSNSGNTDLLFYDRTSGQAEFHFVYPAGNMGSIGALNTGWRKTWDQIVPGDFDNDKLTDLLLYDKTNGVGYFQKVWRRRCYL